MGNGASQSLQARHSDSRISSLRLDREGGGGVGCVSDSSRSSGNNTVTLRFSVQEFSSGQAPGTSAEGRKPRARSLGGDDVSSTAVAVSQALQALDEGREDHNSSSASLTAAESNNKASPRPPGDSEAAELNAYDDEPFEEDTIEWKKADALGSGSYGTVYLARDERTGALMAVKEIIVAEESDLDVENASREVTLLRSLGHENIVKYLGSHVDYSARKLHIFTEWVPGGNLEQNRKRFGGSERVVKRFTRQILSGVAYLHSKCIIHHDIKPSNLLVDQYGVVKLADFGSSRLMSTSTIINNESMRGTPNYMAPEVIKQIGPRSFKSDIWSVGCSVLRLLTGQSLWGDKRFDSQIALLYFIAHLEQLPPLPADLSPEAKSFISLCLEIDPVKRPTADELLEHPFVGGKGSFPLSSASSFLLPSRSTLVALPPLTTTKEPVARVLTAPADYASCPSTEGDQGGSGAFTQPSRRAPPTTAPASVSAVTAMSPTASRSQLVSARFPPRGLSDERSDASTMKKREENPEVASLSSIRSKNGMRPARSLLGSTAGSILSSVHGPGEIEEEDDSEIYSFNEFTETMPTTSRSHRPSGSRWEDRPILTDAARAERERQLARAAEEKQKKEERERKYQEELVEFRRLILEPPHSQVS